MSRRFPSLAACLATAAVVPAGGCGTDHGAPASVAPVRPATETVRAPAPRRAHHRSRYLGRHIRSAREARRLRRKARRAQRPRGSYKQPGGRRSRGKLSATGKL
jgi:hypothetical protein